MTDEQKANNRWAMTRAVLFYIGVYGVGLMGLAALGNTTAVASLGSFVLGILGLASTLIGINFATPVGGFKKG